MTTTILKKIPVGILGATGIVGQSYLSILQNHPWFEVTFLSASPGSAGKTYEEAISKRWHFSSSLLAHVSNQIVHSVEEIDQAKDKCSFVFSALPSDVASKYEHLYAKADLPVISNASSHRKDRDVPVLIPEINSKHLELIDIQKKLRGWKRGFILTKPNCSIQSFMLPLHPLHQLFQIKELHITTLQAISGSGYPGVASYDILDNVIPYIPHEEEKTETEPLKIWGSVQKGEMLHNQTIKISAHCTRVPVMHGHMATVSVKFEKKPSTAEIIELWNKPSPLKDLNLPTLPPLMTIYKEEANRPQPRLDRDLYQGMAATAGRLRPCNILDYRFVCLSHNTFRGAAGGGILNAELLTAMGYLH